MIIPRVTLRIIFISVLLSFSSLLAAANQDGSRYGEWTQICKQETGEKLCFLRHRNASKDNMVALIVGIQKSRRLNKLRMRMLVPFGVFIPSGIQLQIGDKKMSAPMQECNKAGCFAVVYFDDKNTELLRLGKQLLVRYMTGRGKNTVNIKVPLDGLSTALSQQYYRLGAEGVKAADVIKKEPASVIQKKEKSEGNWFTDIFSADPEPSEE